MEHINLRIDIQQKSLKDLENTLKTQVTLAIQGLTKNIQDMFNNLSTKIETMAKSSADQHTATPALPDHTQGATYAQMVATQLTQLQHKTWI